jgi:hypothetical protein
MCTVTDQEFEAWQARASQAVEAMTYEQRHEHLMRSDYSPFPCGEGKWGVIGDNGVVANDFASERAAESWIIINQGIFDDI